MVSLGRGFSNDWDMSTSKRNFKFSQEVAVNDVYDDEYNAQNSSFEDAYKYVSVPESKQMLSQVFDILALISNIKGFDMARSSPVVHQPTLKIGSFFCLSYLIFDDGMQVWKVEPTLCAARLRIIRPTDQERSQVLGLVEGAA